MNQLIKYILIVSFISIILFGCTIYTGVKSAVHSADIAKAEINRLFKENGEITQVPDSNYPLVNWILVFILKYILPIFVIIMGFVYYIKSRKFLKTFIIPLTYSVLSFIILMLAFKSHSTSFGILNLSGLFFLAQFLIIFLITLILNTLIYYFKK